MMIKQEDMMKKLITTNWHHQPYYIAMPTTCPNSCINAYITFVMSIKLFAGNWSVSNSWFPRGHKWKSGRETSRSENCWLFTSDLWWYQLITGALLQLTYGLLSVETVRNKRNHGTILIRGQSEIKIKTLEREKDYQSLNIAALMSGLTHSLAFIKNSTTTWDYAFFLCWVKHELRWWSRTLHSRQNAFGYPNCGWKGRCICQLNKAPFYLFFLKGEGKINGYLYFVETQSILCESYPLNGDEGTIMEYGHSTVTAELGCWPVVQVFVLDL